MTKGKTDSGQGRWQHPMVQGGDEVEVGGCLGDVEVGEEGCHPGIGMTEIGHGIVANLGCGMVVSSRNQDD